MEMTEAVQLVINLGVAGVLLWRLRIADQENAALRVEIKDYNSKVWELVEKTKAITNLLWTDEVEKENGK